MLSNLRRLVASVQQMPVFSQAMELASEKRFDEAEVCFGKALESAASDTDAVYILQRLAMVQRTLNKPPSVEETLEKVLYFSSGPEKQLAQSNLLLQYLQSNIEKALSLSTDLMASEESLLSQAELDFFLGTAYLLRGDKITEGKDHLKTSLELEPGQSKGFVLHNLATANWWAAYAYAGKEAEAYGSDEFKNASYDFQDAVPTYIKAIGEFERDDKPFAEEDTELKSLLSGLTLTNIAEIFLQTKQIENSLIWLKKSMKLYESLEPASLARPYILLGILMRSQDDIVNAKELLKAGLKLLPEDDMSFTKVLGNEVMGNILGDDNVYSERAEELRSKIPYWSERASYLYIPTWNLT